MEKRKFEIECNWFAIGERVRLVHDHSITGTVREMRPPTSVSRASVLIKHDHSGTTACFYCEIMEPIPEPPITREEIGLAMLHKDFRSFQLGHGGNWSVELVGKWVGGYATRQETLEAMVRELRKRDTDANKKEQS